MKIIKWLLLATLLTGFTYGQSNLIFTPGTVESNDSITIDLGFDTEKVMSEYGSSLQEETRAIAFLMQGTWTNDSLQVYAAVDPDSTYYPVYFGGAVVTEVATTGDSYIAFNPQRYAGIRYLMFIMPANEAATRIYWIIRRLY